MQDHPRQRHGIADEYELPIALNPVFSKRLLLAMDEAEGQSPEVIALDEGFWGTVRREYLTTQLTNLNNGGVSPQPVSVQEAEWRLTRLLNYAPAHQMWRLLEPAREVVRRRLAVLAGVDAEEVAIVRNTTEAMANLIYGVEMKPGDAVVLAHQDYPNVIECWKNRAERDGLEIVWIDLPLTTEDDGEIVSAYVSSFSDKTRALNLTSMINWTGRIMPVMQIATEATRRGMHVLVDAAHSFQQYPFNFSEIPCTGIATVLHKWLCAPFGTGMVYIPKANISGIRPIFPLKNTGKDDIRKFEGLGTRNYGTELAIIHAIDFMGGVGFERKYARFQFLKRYWTDRAQRVPTIEITTPLAPEFSCNLVHFRVDGIPHTEVAERLLRDYQIDIVAFEWANVSGLRVTPNIYTSLEELDKLVHALHSL